MRFSPILLVHICTGIIAVLFGSVALLVRKGGHRHRLTGDIFVIAMLMMSASGAYTSFRASQRLNIVAALFTFYLVSTAWLTVQRKPKEMGSVEFGLLLVGFAVGIIALTFTWQAGHGGGQSASYLIFRLGGSAFHLRRLIPRASDAARTDQPCSQTRLTSSARLSGQLRAFLCAFIRALPVNLIV